MNTKLEIEKRISINKRITKALRDVGLEQENRGVCTGKTWTDSYGEPMESFSPADGRLIATVKQATNVDYEMVVEKAQKAFLNWRTVPVPQRGEIVQQIGNALRDKKEELAIIVSYEMGKIMQEGLGEVQEMIDICDYAVEQSRQLYGIGSQSERQKQKKHNQYHPLGVVGVLSAYNFPVAGWAWNAMLALVSGDTVVWKPSSKALLSAIAVHKIVSKVFEKNNIPEGVLNLVATGSQYLSDEIVNDKRLQLIAFAGPTGRGEKVGKIVGERLGRTILKLGGNNAVIITANANIENAIQSVIFGAISTCGQRDTSTRRVIIHESLYESFKKSLIKSYKTLIIGNPLNKGTQVGPLVDEKSVESFLESIKKVKEHGGKIVFGGKMLKKTEEIDSECYVEPCIAEVESHLETIKEETFGPLLYLIKYRSIDEAIEINNNVPQGTSSSIFSDNVLETEKFLSHECNDSGIVNVNIGTTGRETDESISDENNIGSEHEAVSNAWKDYMCQPTDTINHGKSIPQTLEKKFDLN